MRKIIPFTIITLISILLLSFTNSTDDETIKWYSWEEAVEANKKNPKPFMVDLYTHWCGYCKKMDRSTFQDPEVVKLLNENFYPVKFNAEQKEDIDWQGVTFKFVANGRRGYHELAAALTDGKLSYPTFVYLNEKFERVMISPGYKVPSQMVPELVFAKEKKYLKMSWEEFKKEFKEQKSKS